MSSVTANSGRHPHRDISQLRDRSARASTSARSMLRRFGLPLCWRCRLRSRHPVTGRGAPPRCSVRTRRARRRDSRDQRPRGACDRAVDTGLFHGPDFTPSPASREGRRDISSLQVVRRATRRSPTTFFRYFIRRRRAFGSRDRVAQPRSGIICRTAMCHNNHVVAKTSADHDRTAGQARDQRRSSASIRTRTIALLKIM